MPETSNTCALRLRRRLLEVAVPASKGRRSIWECMFIDIVHIKTKHNFLIGNFYRPPHKLIDHLNIFLSEFSDILQSIASEKINKSFIVGDTNIDLLKIHENIYSEMFYNDVISAAFKPLTTLPTRLSIRNSLIDNIFTNSFSQLLSGILSAHIYKNKCMLLLHRLIKSIHKHTLPKFIKKNSIEIYVWWLRLVKIR